MDERTKGILWAAAILGVAIVWAASMINVPRFTLRAAGDVAYRLDSQTGEIIGCIPEQCAPVPIQEKTFAEQGAEASQNTANYSVDEGLMGNDPAAVDAMPGIKPLNSN